MHSVHAGVGEGHQLLNLYRWAASGIKSVAIGIAISTTNLHARLSCPIDRYPRGYVKSSVADHNNYTFIAIRNLEFAI